MALARLRSLRDDELTRPISGLGYRQYPRLREEVQSLGNMITGPAAAVMPPTEAQKARLQELVGEVNRAAAKLDELLKRDVAHINELMSRTPRIIITDDAVTTTSSVRP